MIKVKIPKVVVINIGPVPSYTGDFPSPFPVMWYVAKDVGELLKIYYPPQEIRKWIAEAAKYHEIPYLLLAVILQQENGPKLCSEVFAVR